MATDLIIKKRWFSLKQWFLFIKVYEQGNILWCAVNKQFPFTVSEIKLEYQNEKV